MHVHVKHSLYLLAIVVLIGKVYPDNGLYCSHSDFLQTILAEPTAYCMISGMSFNLLWLYNMPCSNMCNTYKHFNIYIIYTHNKYTLYMLQIYIYSTTYLLRA